MTREPRASAAPPDFSPLAASYARGRPRYPEELFDFLSGLVDRHDLAWDAATGNGQAAVSLARHFTRVVATDISAEQIRHATPHRQIEYRAAPSDRSGVAPASVDLVTVATALHWFDLPSFFAEVRRVVRPGGVLAAWSYHAGTCDPPFDGLLHHFYWNVVRPYFAPGAALVDDLYETIDFPGEKIEPRPFRVTADWTLEQTLDYLRSWSAVATYREQRGVDPVEEFAPELARLWDDPRERRPFCMPIALHVRRMP
ncbi:MAG: class I SAM-dependent methyltransferase [Thermoanaerobaculia bacterium]